MIDFNTSHVNVNLSEYACSTGVCLISIHLMLMLITSNALVIIVGIYFNTSHVNVNPAVPSCQ